MHWPEWGVTSISRSKAFISLPLSRLPAREIEPMTAARVKAIRKSVAKSPREFAQRFGVPARTLKGWEQGKKVDVAARVLLTVIEKNPKAAEKALGE